MDGDRLRLPANRNCYKLSRVSWALLKLLLWPTLYIVSCSHGCRELPMRMIITISPFPLSPFLGPFWVFADVCSS